MDIGRCRAVGEGQQGGTRYREAAYRPGTLSSYHSYEVCPIYVTLNFLGGILFRP